MLWFQVLCEYFQECSRNLFFVFFLVLFFFNRCTSNSHGWASWGRSEGKFWKGAWVWLR